MAGRMNCTSVQTSSDAYDVCSYCTPCNVDGTRHKAVQYCPHCLEYLCTTCSKCHQQMKATKQHVLMGARQAKLNPASTSTSSSTVIGEKCWYHPDRTIEMYCGNHDMVYCTRCIATQHRSCRRVTDLDHATIATYTLGELKSLQSEIDGVYKKLDEVSKLKEKSLKETAEQNADILHRIKDSKKKMIDHIEKLEKEATDVLGDKYREVKNDLEKERSRLTEMMGRVEERRKKTNVAVQMNKGQRFIQYKLGQKVAKECKILVNETASSRPKKLVFTEDEKLVDEMMANQSFGQITAVIQEKELVMKTVFMETRGDVYKCLIVDLCQLHDGTILCIDQRNESLKKIDENNNVERICDFNSEPTGICCVGQNEVAIKLKSNEVVFLTVRNGFYKENVGKTICVEDGGSWGMAYFKGYLWMSCRNSICVFTLDGELSKEIQHVHYRGEVIELSPVHLAVRKNLIFLTTGNCGNKVLSLDLNGEVKYVLKDEKLKCPRGVCCETSEGKVFVSGTKSNNVLMFNRDGNCEGEIVSGKQMHEKGSLALLFDDTRNLLFITNNTNSKITIVHC